MNIVLTSVGSTGDVQPLFALAHEIRKQGDRPILALSGMYEKRTRSLGFDFKQIGSGNDLELLWKIGLSQMESADHESQLREYLGLIMPTVPLMYRQLLDISESADVLVSTPFHFAARMVSDTNGTPLATVHLSPFGTTGGSLSRETGAPIVNSYRKREGLDEIADPLGKDGASPMLSLFAVSSHVFARPADWPEHYKLCGYFFLDEEGYEPPRALCEFIESGDPPLVVSFSSMPFRNPHELLSVIVEAIGQAGCRAIIQEGEAGLVSNATLPDSIRSAGFVPHRWLFPRASCIVHHGGAGSTGAAFRAGVPAVFVPHLLDQPLWGEYARSLGCASDVIPLSELSAGRLASAIMRAMTKPKYMISAKRIGEMIALENGTETAYRFIKELA